MTEIEKKKIKLAIIRASSAIEEFEIKIMEGEAEIARLRSHIELQKKVIADNEAKLS